ncbi:enkurin-like [Megalops cyprinoides]|uniref:enkurin-like n=1 Tax=Megalops cyprinoides TaxID=118141 RepID=UPI00186458CD|nr:enkurin-like [Megalops cyprinoides]
MELAESIYNLIPREEIRFERPPRYVSKYRDQVRQEAQMNKASHRTMGLAKVELPSPEKFLRKHSKEPKLFERKTKQVMPCTDDSLKRPTLSLRLDNSWKRTPSKKDFIKANAVDTILAVPKKPQPAYAFTKHGDRRPLEPSGLVPKYVNKKDYGQTPEYLHQRKEEMRRAQEEYDEYVKERLQQGAMKQLSEEERQSTLEGLKKNWDELHFQYQGLSLITDTLPKRYRKEKLEMEMKQLERDIDLIERHKTIYIANT